MDVVEVVLHDKTDGQPLTVEFHGVPGSEAEFDVHLWKLMDDGTGTTWQPSLTAVSPAETLTRRATDGNLFYTIPEIDTTAFNRLGLIITRLDSREDADPVGAYTILLSPGQGRHRGRIQRIERAAASCMATRLQGCTAV